MTARPTDAEMLALLRALEFSLRSEKANRCPLCYVKQGQAHAATCELSSAITRLSAADGEADRLTRLEAALRKAEKALSRAEEWAGTPKAKDAVKLRPADWHAVGNAIRAALASTEAKP